MDFVVPADHRVKVEEGEKLGMNLARELKKLVDHEGDGDTDCIWGPLNNPLKPGKDTGLSGNQEKNQNHPYQNTAKIAEYI